MVTVHNFTYGLLNPVLGYAISCLGAFLGLRCVTLARYYPGLGRARWLGLAAVSIGATGIWAMHFIAMLGFTIPGQEIYYNVPLTIGSMLIAVAVVGVGLFIVGFGPSAVDAAGPNRAAVSDEASHGARFHGAGFRGAGFRGAGFRGAGFRGAGFGGDGFGRSGLRESGLRGSGFGGAGFRRGGGTRLLAGGVIIGVGVAAMHYMGMAAMSMQGSMSYNVPLVVLSVLIAIVAGTAALWIGTWIRGVAATIGAALIMGVAVSGMHYTGMAALRVHAMTMPSMAVAAGSGITVVSGAAAASFLIPLVLVTSLVTFVLTLTISLAPTEQEISADAEMARQLWYLEQRRR